MSRCNADVMYDLIENAFLQHRSQED